MTDLVIHDLNPELATRLQARAATRGRTAEAEARAIIENALGDQHRELLVDLARELFGPQHGIELELPPRPRAEPPPELG